MRVDTEAYKVYLEKKYLPGRSIYLNHFVYPKYLKEFQNRLEMEIYDFGCGTGEFIKYCSEKGIKAIGIDFNYSLVEKCQKEGLHVIYDNIVTFSKSGLRVANAICDNVIEHLSLDEIHQFFKTLKNIMPKGAVLLIIVPGRKGFQKDPTHITFIDTPLIANLCSELNIQMTKKFYLPVNSAKIGDFFYLNMSVYKLVF